MLQMNGASHPIPSQVMPDVMTPDSMVAKLDEFESMADDTVTQEDRDVSFYQQTHTSRRTKKHKHEDRGVRGFRRCLCVGGGLVVDVVTAFCICVGGVVVLA